MGKAILKKQWSPIQQAPTHWHFLDSRKKTLRQTANRLTRHHCHILETLVPMWHMPRRLREWVLVRIIMNLGNKRGPETTRTTMTRGDLSHQGIAACSTACIEKVLEGKFMLYKHLYLCLMMYSGPMQTHCSGWSRFSPSKEHTNLLLIGTHRIYQVDQSDKLAREIIMIIHFRSIRYQLI